MEAAAHTDPEAWLQQRLPALKVRLSNSSRMPQGKKLRTAKTGQIRRKVQVSLRVKQVTNPSRWKEEQRHLPKITHHPQNHDLRKNPKNQKKKPHPFSLIT